MTDNYSLDADSSRWWWPQAAAGVVGAVAITAILVVPSTGLRTSPAETTQDMPSAPDPWFATVEMDMDRPCFLTARGGTSPWTSRGPAAAGRPPTGRSGPARSARVSAPSPEIRPRRARRSRARRGSPSSSSCPRWRSLTTLSAGAILAAMIEGGSDAQVLAAIARGRIRSKLPDLAAQALEGHFDAHPHARGVDPAPTASSASPTAPRWPGNSRAANEGQAPEDHLSPICADSRM